LATAASPKEITYLTPSKAKQLGIEVAVIDPDDPKQANAQPVAPPMPITPVTPQAVAPAPERTRDCTNISMDLSAFFPASFNDCYKEPAANSDHVIYFYKPLKTWDRFIPSSGRYITRTLEVSYRLSLYRLIAEDHDANGSSNGGSVCYFNFDKTWSDCENTAGEHYQLHAGSMKLFLNIATGTDPGAVTPQPAKPAPAPQRKVPAQAVKPLQAVK
jgi:hypothetical protein